MRAAFATLALAGLAAANPAPQAVTSAIAPAQSPPAGCYPNYDGTFLIGPVNVSSSSKRDVEAAFEIIALDPADKRNTQLGITLKNGILTDPQGRTGYIAANQQFQFDGPPQAGAIWTAGFSVCDNRRLALGSDETWWRCLSGTFYNLYFKSIGGQCIESYLIASPVGGTGGPVASGAAGTGTTATTPAEPSTVSASGASSSGSNATATANSTVTASSSGSMTASSSMMTTVINGHTTVVPVGHKTTANPTNTASTTPTPNGSPTSAAASSSSSSVSSGAAPMATLKNEVMGLAAGLLAIAAL